MAHVMLIALLLIIPHLVLAQGQEADAIKVKYIQSQDLPDDMFFRQFLHAATPASSGHDRDDFVLLLQHKIGFDEFQAADDFYTLLEQLKTDMADAHAAEKRRKLCPFDQPRPSGSEVFTVMDELDEEWDKLGKRYLNQLRSTLTRTRYQNLQAWMDEIKERTIFVRFDHAKQHAGADADAVRQVSCGRFDRRQAARNAGGQE